MGNVKAIDAKRIGYVYKMPYRKVAIDCFVGELVLKVPINSVQASWSIEPDQGFPESQCVR